MRRWHTGSLLLTTALILPALAAALEVPFLSGPVVDQAGMLDSATRQSVEQRLRALEQATGAQVVVLTIPSLEGEPIGDFAIQVAEAWKLGRAEVDDGVIFLVAPNDRRMRIEVGYGLEATLTDATANRILDELVTPHFRAGDMAAGIAIGAEAIARVVEGSELPAPSRAARSGKKKSSGAIVFFALAFVLVILVIGRHSGDDGGPRFGGSGGGFWGGLTGGGGFSGGGGSFGGGGASGGW